MLTRTAIAMDIGRSYFLEQSIAPESYEGEDGFDWLRVWSNVLFLHKFVNDAAILGLGASDH